MCADSFKVVVLRNAIVGFILVIRHSCLPTSKLETPVRPYRIPPLGMSSYGVILNNFHIFNMPLFSCSRPCRHVFLSSSVYKRWYLSSKSKSCICLKSAVFFYPHTKCGLFSFSDKLTPGWSSVGLYILQTNNKNEDFKFVTNFLFW